MRRILLPALLAPFSLFALVALIVLSSAAWPATGCSESDPDSVELGCRSDADCFKPGEPQRWCQRDTGICMAFTSPPGDTTEQDATPQPPADAGQTTADAAP